MALGSLTVWLGVPVAWFWLTRNLQSAAARYLIVIIGCPITMVLAAGLLYRLEAVYAQITGAASQGPASLTLLETFLVASALVALVALVGWWAFLADSANPSGPLQPI
jgi:hypothetical protein